MTHLLSLEGSDRIVEPKAVPTEALVVAEDDVLGREVAAGDDVQWQVMTPTAFFRSNGLFAGTLLYVPRYVRQPDLCPDLDEARQVLARARDFGLTHAVVLSSTLVYGASWNHPGLATERRPSVGSGQPVARVWLDLESLSTDVFSARAVTLLRAAPTPLAGGADYFSRLLGGRLAIVVSGYDPTLQFLTRRDLADAMRRAASRRLPGVFNVVPAAPIPLRAALRGAGCRIVPVPLVLQRAVRRASARMAGAASADQLQFIRFNLTASGEKTERDLGFVARDTSLRAARAAGRRRVAQDAEQRPTPDGPAPDPFGLDPSYIRACSRGVMGFLHRRYWRIETDGLDRIPSEGAAVLVGMHRGFMPFDGVMTLLTLAEQKGRIPRFLIHPGLLKFPYLFNLMSKLGGVVACGENADRVLGAGELLGVYPEGIRGAFSMYKQAHRIAPSWRNDCIAFALRHRAPIVPFVTVGSAEIFPILGRIKAHRWTKYSEWPFIPITPTFPLLPVPLPSKWHTLFLQPLHVEREHSPDAAADPAVVRAIATAVKRRMESAVADLVARRPSVFYGSVFGASNR